MTFENDRRVLLAAVLAFATSASLARADTTLKIFISSQHPAQVWRKRSTNTKRPIPT